VSSILALLLLFCSGASILAVFLIIQKYDKLKKLDSEEYKSKFGPL
jgi:hypothetical protein